MDHSISQTICKLFLFRPSSVLLFRYWYWFSGWWRYELEDAGDVGANASVQILTNVIGAIQPSNGVISAVSSARIFDALDKFFEGWPQRDTLSLIQPSRWAWTWRECWAAWWLGRTTSWSTCTSSPTTTASPGWRRPSSMWSDDIWRRELSLDLKTTMSLCKENI